MANAYKVLGQVEPDATTLTTLYTVPASTSTIVSKLMCCNKASASGTVRVAVRPAGAVVADKHYIVYDLAVSANDTLEVVGGLTLATTDVLSVYASSADWSFSAFGVEVT